MRRTLALSLLLLCLPAAAAAQTITVPEPVSEPGCSFGLADATANLTRHFLRRHHAAFREHAKDVIEAAARKCAPGAKISVHTDVIQLLWVDADPLTGDDMVYRALVHKGNDDPASTLLPGVSEKQARPKVFEIFVSNGLHDAIASVYTSTRERNPLEEQLPAVAQAVFDPFLGLAGAVKGVIKAGVAPPAAPESSEPPPPPPYAMISRVDLPFSRAAVHVDVRVDLLSDEAGITAAAARLSNRNQFVTGARFQCVRGFDTAMKAIVTANAAACAKTPKGCALKLGPGFQAAFTAAFASCSSEIEQKELLAVDAAYRSLVSGLASQVDGKFDLKNTPRQLISFGVMTAFAFRGKVADGHSRVKLNDDGNLTLDPLGRQLNLVVVNGGFKPYDADAFHPTPAERFQWFAGAVVTPDFGLALGLSAGIVRGLTVNGGVAVLGVRGLRDGDELGAAPADSNDPFKLSRATVAFFGLGYKFK